MYVDTSSVHRNGRTYTRYLLRESYRDGGKVKHRTLANLSHCSPQEIQALRVALRHKQELTTLGTLPEAIELKQGASIGAIWVVYELARQLGIAQALGHGRPGKLALWQVLARVIDQGSRLSAVRLASAHTACDLLGLDPFNEEDLYANLDWLCTQQVTIETRLFHHRRRRSAGLFLYDTTSSYLEGTQNELAAFGYNRDGKRGKRQIVMGLLCDSEGVPLSIEVFAGNTQDPQTFTAQVQKVAARFGGGEVTFVGDRGMIKSHQIEALGNHRFHYITAITKPQIETLLKNELLRMNLFEDALAEVNSGDGVRYILRRNPARVQEVAAARDDKYRTLEQAVAEQNQYLATHPRAHVAVALRTARQRSETLRIASWIMLTADGRTRRLVKEQAALAEIAKLDGCYVLKTDLAEHLATKEIIHERYRDLALIEWAFRESKTVHLEMRPLYVRRESRTRGHAVVVMLAYLIIKELATRWQALDLTVEEGIDQLTSLCLTEVHVQGHAPYFQVPQPRDTLQRLLAAANVQLPDALPNGGVIVTTKKKLPTRRKKK